ncbi:hypothetical protein [Caulobacter sp. NIBR1757]|uniref:hypothetical protein n=1 Tax=Caulobacter sp. NIBR1757 TaxID=3016000 RepID=UPI0022F08BD6|nr:hypothetical protein [Caulobacter sp. NIBR1757]
MRVLEKVGHRDVVASGVAVLSSEGTLTVNIEDINYIFEINLSSLPPSCYTEIPNSKSLKFKISGSLGIAAQWVFDNVGTINGNHISLTFVAVSYTGNAHFPPGVEIRYTFLAQPFYLAGVVG